MRYAALALFIATTSPGFAWQAGVDGPRCTLTHAEDGATIRLTYDPSVPLYTITLTAPEPWPVASQFGMGFYGPQPATISTTRHVLSPDRLSLSVSDRGFGNVLDGLAFNEAATAFSGAAVLAVSLEGAAPEVAIFRSCGQVPSV